MNPTPSANKEENHVIWKSLPEKDVSERKQLVRRKREMFAQTAEERTEKATEKPLSRSGSNVNIVRKEKK